MKNYQFKDDMLIKIVIYGLIGLAVVVLLVHFMDKNYKGVVSKNATSNYIEKNVDDPDVAKLIGKSAEEADFATKTDDVEFHTLEMRTSTSVSMLIKQVQQVHFDIMRSGNTKELRPEYIQRLDEIKVQLEENLDSVGQVVPSGAQAGNHGQLMENVAEVIVELEAYQEEIKNGKEFGPTPDLHITRMNAIFGVLSSS